MHVVGHYHDFFSLSQLRYIVGTYIMAWHTWHCGWNSSWFSFFFQYNINIYIYSQSNLTIYSTSYTHNITIFHKSFPSIHITYVLSIQSGVR